MLVEWHAMSVHPACWTSTMALLGRSVVARALPVTRRRLTKGSSWSWAADVATRMEGLPHALRLNNEWPTAPTGPKAPSAKGLEPGGATLRYPPLANGQAGGYVGG